MRNFIFAILLLLVFQSYSQTAEKIMISGTVLSTDSVPIPDVAIINIWSGNIVRTDVNGFFKIEILPGDSLLVYHMSYKNMFISKNTQGGYIILKPEIHELLQVNVHDKSAQEQRNLQQTISDIKRLVPLNKLTGFDLKSIQDYFADENGSPSKGFSPFFGPTINIPIEKSRKVGFAKYLNIRNR
jgi:hypothetical protein